MSDRYQEYASRHWERKRCKLCREYDRECPRCAGVGP